MILRRVLTFRCVVALWKSWVLKYSIRFQVIKLLCETLRNEKFLLDIHTKCGDIPNEVLNATIDAERTFKCKWSKVMSQRETLYNFLYIKKHVGLILDLFWPFFKFELTQLDICGSKYNLFFSSIWCSILSLKSKQFDLKLETFDQTSVEYWNLVYQDSGPLDPLSPKDNRKF